MEKKLHWVAYTSEIKEQHKSMINMQLKQNNSKQLTNKFFLPIYKIDCKCL